MSFTLELACWALRTKAAELTLAVACDSGGGVPRQAYRARSTLALAGPVTGLGWACQPAGKSLGQFVPPVSQPELFKERVKPPRQLALSNAV